MMLTSRRVTTFGIDAVKDIVQWQRDNFRFSRSEFRVSILWACRWCGLISESASDARRMWLYSKRRRIEDNVHPGCRWDGEVQHLRRWLWARKKGMQPLMILSNKRVIAIARACGNHACVSPRCRAAHRFE